MTIRSFLAIEIPAEIIQKVGAIQNDLRAAPAQVKWVRPEGLHLTLKFFGNIEEKTVEEICKRVLEVASKIPPFALEVKGIGAFPNLNYPRVLWVGICFQEGTLDFLHRELEGNLQQIGFQSEKRGFSPHLTLGRVKSLKGKQQFIQRVEKIQDWNLGSFSVESLFLFKSELRPTGAVYTKLSVFDLARRERL